jgi:hypothetical protein
VQSSKDPEGLRVFYYLVQVGSRGIVVKTREVGEACVGITQGQAGQVEVAAAAGTEQPAVHVAAPLLLLKALVATAPVWRNVGGLGGPKTPSLTDIPLRAAPCATFPFVFISLACEACLGVQESPES